MTDDGRKYRKSTFGTYKYRSRIRCHLPYQHNESGQNDDQHSGGNECVVPYVSITFPNFGRKCRYPYFFNTHDCSI